MESTDAQLKHRITVERKTGNEQFRCTPSNQGFSLLDFWQWSASDLVGNTNRGRLAEFIVARALGLGIDDVQNEWEGYDLVVGTTKVEVKSSAYIQSWPQSKLCTPYFSIAPRRAWDQNEGKLGSEIRRHSSVYVFALLANKDKQSIDPLDASQWQFYVVPTAELDKAFPLDRHPARKSIGLREVCRLCPAPVAFEFIETAVQELFARQRDGNPDFN